MQVYLGIKVMKMVGAQERTREISHTPNNAVDGLFSIFTSVMTGDLSHLPMPHYILPGLNERPPERGPPGPQGERGRDGSAGIEGRHGLDGRNGYDGTPCQQGQTRSAGRDGRDGHDGRDGQIGQVEHGGIPQEFVVYLLERDERWLFKDNLMVLATLYREDGELAKYAMDSLRDLRISGDRIVGTLLKERGAPEKYGLAILDGLERYNPADPTKARDYMEKEFAALGMNDVEGEVKKYMAHFDRIKGGTDGK